MKIRSIDEKDEVTSCGIESMDIEREGARARASISRWKKIPHITHRSWMFYIYEADENIFDRRMCSIRFMPSDKLTLSIMDGKGIIKQPFSYPKNGREENLLFRYFRFLRTGNTFIGVKNPNLASIYHFWLAGKMWVHVWK